MSLDAAANGAANVALGCRRMAAGKDEAVEGGGGVDKLLHLHDVHFRGEVFGIGCSRHGGADGEEAALNGVQHAGVFLGEVHGEEHSNVAVELVERAAGFNLLVVFRHDGAVGQRGRAVVALAGGDVILHGFWGLCGEVLGGRYIPIVHY